MKTGLLSVLLVTLFLGLLTSQLAWAERGTEEEMRQVCENWLAYMVYQRGGWAGEVSPTIVDVQEILSDGRVLARYYAIAPRGYIVVPVLKEMPPVKAYSEEYELDVTATVGFPQMLREDLALKFTRWEEMYGSLDATRPTEGDVLFGPDHRQEWDRYAVESGVFAEELDGGAFAPMAEVGPLLTSAWHQGSPYNNLCPMGDGGRSVVGCVATAAAQIMNYHRCPNNGIGSHSYVWDGDQSCGGDVGGGTLSATFSDTYVWGDMPDNCSGGCSAAEEAALSELCYEVGVAFEMDYGVCASGCNTFDALTVYPTYFGYDGGIDREDRDAHTPATWFDIIKDQINGDQPIQYRIIGHSIVCDGWRDTGGINQYHVNYGWGGANTGWFSIDNIPGSTDPVNEEYLIRGIRPNCVVNQPPVALCQNVTVSADANCVAAANINNGSYDPEGAPVWLTQTPPGPYPLGQTQVTLTVGDDFGWESQCLGRVTVEDNTDPVISCPAYITVEATDACGTPSDDPQLDSFWAGASAVDNCDPNPVITDNRPACFILGTTLITFTATDASNNSDLCQQTVRVQDTTPPDIVCPDEIRVECNGPQGTYATDPQLDAFWAGVSATDIVDPNPVITNDAPALLPIGETFVTFTATDFSSNAASCSVAVTVVDRGIDIWLEDMTVNPGDNVLVPVYIQDVTGWGILGFDMELCWCELPVGLLEFEYCVIGEVMTASGWGDPVCGPCGDDCISIAGAGATPLEGEGVLFYLKFAVSTNAKPCMCCDLWFTHINLYDPEDPLHVCWQDGEICVDWCDVEGVVNYWKCCFDECDDPYFITQLDGAYMHLTHCLGNHIASQYTRCGGTYLFDCLDPLSLANGCYCVSIDYCPILPCVTAMDAALVLQNVVCLDDLDECPFNWNGGIVYPQQVAADVNCSGVVTSLDASYILQYSVGLINIFPCPDMWKFYAIPGNCAYACPGEIDWIGVMYGDVNGCYACPPVGPMPDVISPASVKLGRTIYYDDRVEIPINVKQTFEVMAADIVVDFDPEVFTVEDVDAIGLASGFNMAFNPIGGTLRIAMAGMSTFSGNGKIANIVLTKNYQPIPTTRGRVSIESAHFNDVEAIVIGDTTERKMEYALGPIAPNPFADGTTVMFTMATAGKVSLSIYNVNGQLVTTLIDGTLPAGQHSVKWDGKGMTGDKLARGVYFCRMTTADMVAIEKLVLMN